jgi:hypothetical protein
MRLYLFLLVLVFFYTSCSDKPQTEWKKLDFLVFTLDAPSDWKIIEKQCIDSYIGGLTDGNDTLIFDIGWYSTEVGEEEPEMHKFVIDTINGKAANIVIPKMDGKGVIAMSIPNLKDNRTHFWLGGRNIRGSTLVLKMFKSVQFPIAILQ